LAHVTKTCVRASAQRNDPLISLCSALVHSNRCVRLAAARAPQDAAKDHDVRILSWRGYLHQPMSGIRPNHKSLELERFCALVFVIIRGLVLGLARLHLNRLFSYVLDWPTACISSPFARRTCCCACKIRDPGSLPCALVGFHRLRREAGPLFIWPCSP
jgi:hypothetical protein